MGLGYGLAVEIETTCSGLCLDFYVLGIYRDLI